MPPVATLPGRVEVVLELPCSGRRAWQALTDPAQVACWFGAVSGPFHTGARLCLSFGDGDFFDLYDVRADAPRSLRYRWRFMGCGPLDTVTWRLEPTAVGTRITLTDDESSRPPRAVDELRQGWLDFARRLDAYVRTGEPTRYDWRRELDVGIELDATPPAAWDRLLGPGGPLTWLPADRPGLGNGTHLILDDGQEPRWLRVTALSATRPEGLEFDLTHSTWRRATHCRIALDARPNGTLLSVSHLEWEAISADPAVSLAQRKRFSRFWVASLRRAAGAVPAGEGAGRAREAS